MRTFTVHTADELVARWKDRAARHGEESLVAHAITVCATELEAVLLASMELEAAHHEGDDGARTCHVCGSTSGSFQLLDEQWQCLKHLPSVGQSRRNAGRAFSTTFGKDPGPFS